MMTQTQQMLTAQQVEQMIQRHFEAQKKEKQLLTKQQMYDLLKALPEQTERAFETTVVKEFALKWDDSNIRQELQELIALVGTGKTPSLEEQKVAFNAFCVAVNYERRLKNFSQEEALLEKHAGEFKANVFYKHMLLLSQMEELESMEDIEPSEDRSTQKRRKARMDALRTILMLAEENARNLTGNVGGLHAFAETVALSFENVPSIMQTLQQERCLADEKAGVQDPECRGWLYHGIAAVNKAIEMDLEEKLAKCKAENIDEKNAKPYPKFLVTKARLEALIGEFEEALNHIKRAIDTEDSQQSDYSIRIGQYRSHRQQILARKTAMDGQKILEGQLSVTMAEYEKKLEEQEKQTVVKNMEFLGLFSGIVSFTIGSLTIGSAIADQSILHAAGLIVVLMGALMGVFAAFGIILHGVVGKKAGRNIFVLLLGLAIVAGGIALCLR